MAICIEIDGVWCPECKKNHPTLMWHEKYNDYLIDRKEKWKKVIKKHFPGKDIAYVDKLSSLGLIECESGKCKICGSDTNFKLEATNDFVCCDKCKYKVLGIGEI